MEELVLLALAAARGLVILVAAGAVIAVGMAIVVAATVALAGATAVALGIVVAVAIGLVLACVALACLVLGVFLAPVAILGILAVRSRRRGTRGLLGAFPLRSA